MPTEDSTSSCLVTMKRSVSSPIAIEIFFATLSLIATAAGSGLALEFPPGAFADRVPLPLEPPNSVHNASAPAAVPNEKNFPAREGSMIWHL